MCDAHHRLDLANRHTPRVQSGVHLTGNLLIRPTPPEIVADEPSHPDQGGVVLRRPGEADTAQLREVCVIKRARSRTRSTGNQGSAGQQWDDQSGQPAG